MEVISRLKDKFNISAIGTFLEHQGNQMMAECSTRARLGGASALGLILLAGVPFGLSAVFGFAALASPTVSYGIGFTMEALGKVVRRIAPQTC
jgi:hypothetical protein